MASGGKLPRLDSVTEALSDAEAAAVLGLMADNLEAAQRELAQRHDRVAQAHTLQALGLAAYALLGIGGRD